MSKKQAAPSFRNRIKEYREVSPSELAPNPRNWREHPEEQLNALRDALGSVGWAVPVIAYETAEGLMLIDGHARLSEASATATIPAIILDVNDAEAAFLLATIDPMSAMAEANAVALEAVMRDVSTDSPAIMAMLSELAERSGVVEALEAMAGDGGDEFDATPEEQGETRAKSGDLWLLGGKHRLIVGDCTDPAVVQRLMGGERADAVVTDPPYGMNLDTEYSGITLSEKAKAKHPTQRDYAPVVGDDKDFDPTFLMEYFAYVQEQYWWGADYYRQFLPEGGSWLVWDKRVGVEDVTFDTASFELCWSKTKHRREIIRARWMGLIGMETQDTKRRVHPTQKPLEVYLWLFENRTKANALVFDGFLGSGTTLIAAHRTGRRCYGAEISERYADVILRRAEAEGLTVELLET